MATGTLSSNQAAELQHKTVYVYGVRAWWARLKIVVIYIVAVVILFATYTSWQGYLENNDLDTMNVVFRSSLLFGLWLIAVVTSWRQGIVRATRVVYLPEHHVLEVRSLNFLSRRVRVADVRRIEYPNAVYHGMLSHRSNVTISIRNKLPIEMDTACVLFDQSVLDQLFQHYNEPASGLSESGRMIL